MPRPSPRRTTPCPGSMTYSVKTIMFQTTETPEEILLRLHAGVGIVGARIMIAADRNDSRSPMKPRY